MTPAEQTARDTEQHVDLILRHVKGLPTLSPIATRILQLSGSGDADIKELVSLIESDPALSARVLAMCRRSDVGARGVTTVSRAVLLMGFEAVRAAMLSLEVIECIGPAADGHTTGFDRRQIWLHSLAAACCAEWLSERLGRDPGAPEPGEAFLCALLHDLGKIALDRLMPKSFARAIEICRAERIDIAEAERRILGLDHHTVGKRLAEHWGLAHAIADSIWLCGQPPTHLPTVPHRRLVQIVIAGIALARELHIGWSGSIPSESTSATIRACELHPVDIARISAQLHERIGRRAEAMGLMDRDDPSLLQQALIHANQELGRLSAAMDQRARQSEERAGILRAIASFHTTLRNANGIDAAMQCVARSAQETLGGHIISILWQRRPGEAIDIHECARDGRIINTRRLVPEHTRADLAALIRDRAGRLDAGQFFEDLVTGLERPCDRERIRIIGLPIPGEAGCALLHEAPEGAAGYAALIASEGAAGEALVLTWAGAIGAGAAHDGARRLGEDLASANRSLIDAQRALVEARADQRLAAMTAGAAHEMNNPLMVISGLAQRLASRLQTDDDRALAQRIAGSAQTLSTIISNLHFFAQPSAPNFERTLLHELVRKAIDAAVETARAAGDLRSDSEVVAVFNEMLPPARLDPEQIHQAVTELILNAIQSGARGRIEVRVEVEREDDRLLITVSDRGEGMTPETLSHAFDPFFSVKPAGRRLGMGLARAQRLVEAHDGTLTLESTPGKGTTARIVLRSWRWRKGIEAGRAA